MSECVALKLAGRHRIKIRSMDISGADVIVLRTQCVVCGDVPDERFVPMHKIWEMITEEDECL